MRQMSKIAIGLVALGAWLVPAHAAQAAPGPAWQLSLLPLPTHFAPGSTGSFLRSPTYLVTATNVGAGDATGPVTLKATLPANVTPIFKDTPPTATPVGQDSDPNSPNPVCAKTPGQTVTCIAEGPVRPSRNVAMKIPVEVSSGLTPGQVLPDATASVESPGATTITASAPTTIDTEPPPFGFLAGDAGLSTLITEEDGSPSLAAGSRPNQLTIDLGFPVEQPGGSGLTTGAGHPRDIVTDLPPGVVIDPNATAVRCTELQLLSGAGAEPGCPAASQIGLVTVTTELAGPQPTVSALYNMVPPPGSAATVAFNAANVGIYVHLNGGVRSESDFGLYAESNDTLARGQSPLEHVQAQLWGDPSSSSHDQIRGACRLAVTTKPCPVDPNDTPLITMPSACSDTLTTRAHARSWEESEEGIEELTHHASAQATDIGGNPTAVSGCSLLEFEPSLTAKPTTNAAESPTGLDVELQIPQNPNEDELATSNVRDVKVSFPAGLAVNPAAASGLEACSPAQIGMTTAVGNSSPHFTRARPNCPNGSKIGTVQVDTPLLDHPVPGAVYAAQPFQNPFGTLLGVYVVIDSPQDGLVVKLAGKTEADPNTGQLTATFTENPQLPFESFKVNLFGGPRAVLRTPSTCGTFTTTSEQKPWSGNPAVNTTDSFQVSSGPNGSPCTSSEAQQPNSPGFEAGTLTPIAGSYSPFLGRLVRNDGEQQIKALNLTLPPGLSGKLAGIATCSDSAIAAAGSSSGTDELNSPSCPSTSEIGQVKTGAGAGSDPYYTSGKIYLAGPYKGAPLSAAVIVPAVAGPFDLGTVVVRAPAKIDPVTAQITVNSDPAPRILQGIPLQVRDIQVQMSRPEFTINPTSCNPMSVGGEAISVLDNVATLQERFQVGGCKGLEFKPKLSLRLKGGTKRGGHPSLRAVLSAKKGEANIARSIVALPRSAFLDQSHIRTVCTRVQFAADNCPKGAIYGQVRATTPLLDEALEGPVYLRSSSNELPDMVAVLKGPPHRPIEIEAVARIDSIRGGIRANFETIPDAPITKVIVTMQGGRKGLLINSRNLCKSTNRATVQMDAHSGKAHDFRPVVKAKCKAKDKKRRGHRRR
jgi:hypothetical protein